MHTDLDRALERHTEPAFDFLERLIAAPSVLGTEQGALEVFAGELEELEFEIERLPFPAEPLADPRAGVHQHLPAAEPRYQVVGRTRGEGELTLLLNGHIDVVPAETPELWASAPFVATRRDGRMFGRGAGDMKGGFAMGVLALKALRDVAPTLFDNRRLGFIGVIEEECTGNGALRSALDGVVAREVVLLEPTDLGLMLGGVGVLWLDVEVVGASAHAQAAHLTTNAVDLGMRIVERVRDWCADLSRREPDPELGIADSPYNVNLGRVSAGDWTSTVPVSATLSLRIGFPRSWTPDRAEAELRDLISSYVASDPDFPSQPRVRTAGFRASGYSLDATHDLVTGLSDAHFAAHGTRPTTFSLGSTTDARIYLNDFGIPAVCFGATAHDIHGIDESVELHSIVDGAKTLALFLLSRFAEDQ